MTEQHNNEDAHDHKITEEHHKTEQDEQHKTEEEIHKTEPHEAEEVKETLCGSHLKSPEELVGMPVFPDGTKSSLSKNLSKEVWEKLKDKKDKFGFSFK